MLVSYYVIFYVDVWWLVACFVALVCGFSGLWLCCSMLLSGVVYCGLLVTCWGLDC